MRALVVILLVFAFCCSGARMGADARARSALEVIAVVVDPAYRLAMDACIARDTLIVERAEAKVITIAEADRQRATLGASCQKQRRAFDAIRDGYDEAAQAVEAGRVEDAEAMIQRVRAEFARLTGKEETAP